MPLETATYIHDLVSANPVGSDGLAQGANHLRLIKAVLLNQFPNLGDAAVSSTAAQIDAAVNADPLAGSSGCIVKMWSGSVASIPSNYHLCDGSVVSINGTNVTLPDLRSRFIVGVDSDTGTYQHGSTGGSATTTTSSDGAHTHTGSTGTYTLLPADIPAHTHTVTDPGHSHTFATSPFGVGTGGGSNGWLNAGNPGGGQPTVAVTIANATTGITIGNTGGGGAHSHSISSDGAHTHTYALPPYYALCFIVRIA